jgi:type 1 glutamine amidotransferase
MDIINYAAPRRLLAVARGHPYDRTAFLGLFEGLDEFDVSLVEQPAAQDLLNPAAAQKYDALVCYDMPGVDFTAGGEAGMHMPDSAFQANFLAMLEVGIGVVFLHHALAAWPAWPEYAEILGGRFHYREAELRGETWPDSGYRHEVTHRLSVAGEHPVTAGLRSSFEMTDELYLCPVFEDEVTPLVRSDFDFTDENFYSSARAVAGEKYSRDGWQHPPGSNLVAWTKRWGNSPIVYLQGGDDAVAQGNENFRQLFHNAVRWVGTGMSKV